MINISHKRNSLRYAKATGKLITTPDVIGKVRNKQVPKGDVLEVSRSAGILAGKRTSEWIVFCHSMPVDWIEITYELQTESIIFYAEAEAVWKTGVEMEAVTAVMAAMLNAYDMLKPLDADITMTEIRLLEKRGGKSDMTDIFTPPVKTALISVDTAKKEGARADRSAEVIREFLKNEPVELAFESIIEEKYEAVKQQLLKITEQKSVELIILCGSTGPAPKDIVPNVIREISDREVPGISHAIYKYGIERTPFAMMSDQTAGIRNGVLMIALPGSSRGSMESMHALFPGLLHIFKTLRRVS
ncbi:MAG: bifunctional molybdenum cofactor biosynthesis protein MoaC/MoaB [Balneolaceae bacterium]|nr:MAG: bifunctional molybdenum cofactor biosynthesis protein MoaC/MoaB [Balneolaceae bacterium]